ncbi:MAG: response regulator transcription factor [Bacteroidales bacterium]|nr:response regulator transcription factor [Bacteroidales bacterium]
MIRCVIVDDEPLAREILEMYVSQNTELQLVGVCKNADEVVALLRKETVDVLFLDIQMPGVSGMQLVKSLENPPLVVFTTAYDQYAVEGFEVSAVDYLLKPISPERFNTAVEKVKEQIQYRKQSATSNDTLDYLFVRADYQDVKILYKDILYVEGLKDYVKIVTSMKRIVTLTNIKGMLEKLPRDKFIRVHKSYIVAKEKVNMVKGNVLKIGDKEIPIGLTFKDNFKKALKLKD